MSNIRIRFTRGENIKFISHLDLMKLFERALRRTGLPIAYSQGFNPHPQMVFGLPLPVGVTSEAEYADFELASDIEPAEFMARLNRELPAGITITDAAINKTGKNIMASISGAVYAISFFTNSPVKIEEIESRLQSFLDKKEIITKKEGKGGVKDVNIRPMIHKLKVYPLTSVPQGYEEFKTAFCIEALLAAGPDSNLKPDLLVAALSEQEVIKADAVRIHRKELFVKSSGKMANPLEVV